MSSEEEKRKSILDFYEGKTKIRHGEARYEVDAILVKAAEKTASTATQMLQSYGGAFEPAQVERLREIEHSPAAIPGLPVGEALTRVVGDVADLLDMQRDVLKELEKGQRENRIIALVGWGIAVVLWWLSR